MPKPAMFVGSSKETKKLIRGLSLNLKDEVDVHNWGTSAWALSRSTLDNIEEKLNAADFAAFILSPDDYAIIRDKKERIPRDNVLFELGISFGVLRRDRTFILAPAHVEPDMHTASDLDGLTVVQYEWDTPGQLTVKQAQEVMQNPASELLREIEPQGCRARPGENGALGRGETTHLETVADGALYVLDSRDSYLGQLRDAVEGGEKVPAKFQFAEGDGGRHWMRLCRSESYEYFKRAKKLLNDNGTRLATEMYDAAGTAAIDFVSLGSGDGSKDAILLRKLAAELSDDDHLYYYPIDISDILLVEAVRHISAHGPPKEQFRCKPVLGDFTNLSSLTEIIAHRSNTNLFSLLGNALGSYDESHILSSISRAMLPGDLVLLEANIGEPQDSVAMLKGDEANQWDLSTLAALDINIEAEGITLKEEEKTDESVIPRTRTLVSYGVRSGGRTTKLRLSALHHYNFEELKTHLSKELKVEWIGDDIVGEGVCLLLGKRKAK